MPIAKKTEIPQDFLNQMKSNLTKNPTPVVEETESFEKKETIFTVQPADKPITEKTVESKKEKYADVMNIRLSKGRRNEIKAFCTSNGVTVTQYIESSFEFFAKEVAAGNIVISKGGITKVSQ